MDLEQALKEIERLKGENNTLTGDKVKAETARDDYKSKFDAEKSKSKDAIESRDKAKANFNSVKEAFKIGEDVTGEDAVKSIVESNKAFSNMQKEYDELAPYKTHRGALDSLIEKQTTEFSSLFEEHKDNEAIMSFIDFDMKNDIKNIAKVNETHAQLTKLVGLVKGSKEHTQQNDNFFGIPEKKDSVLDAKQNETQQTDKNDSWVDFSKLS